MILSRRATSFPEGFTSLIVHLLFIMTASKLQAKPVRKATTTTNSPAVVITKQRDFTHKEPIIIPSHLDEVPVISAASYVKDARNRWYIHNVELKEVFDAHVNVFNVVKPHAIKAHDYIVERFNALRGTDA